MAKKIQRRVLAGRAAPIAALQFSDSSPFEEFVRGSKEEIRKKYPTWLKQWAVQNNRAYRNGVKHFFFYLKNIGKQNLNDLDSTEKVFKKFAAYLARKGCGAATIKVYQKAIRPFLRDVCGTQSLPEDFAASAAESSHVVSAPPKAVIEFDGNFNYPLVISRFPPERAHYFRDIELDAARLGSSSRKFVPSMDQALALLSIVEFLADKFPEGKISNILELENDGVRKQFDDAFFRNKAVRDNLVMIGVLLAPVRGGAYGDPQQEDMAAGFVSVFNNPRESAMLLSWARKFRQHLNARPAAARPVAQAGGIKQNPLALS